MEASWHFLCGYTKGALGNQRRQKLVFLPVGFWRNESLAVETTALYFAKFWFKSGAAHKCSANIFILMYRFIHSNGSFTWPFLIAGSVSVSGSVFTLYDSVLLTFSTTAQRDAKLLRLLSLFNDALCTYLRWARWLCYGILTLKFQLYMAFRTSRLHTSDRLRDLTELSKSCINSPDKPAGNLASTPFSLQLARSPFLTHAFQEFPTLFSTLSTAFLTLLEWWSTMLLTSSQISEELFLVAF